MNSSFSVSSMFTRTSHFFRGSGPGAPAVEVPFLRGTHVGQGPSLQAPFSEEAEDERASPRNGARFDFSSLLQLRSFVVLLLVTVLALFQINNILAIQNLSARNDRLRSTIRLTESVLASQELKVRELQSIHSLTEVAGGLGLAPSSEPPVELEP
ncbi:MAG: hypothetical protein RAO75_06970 [Candidatus Chlorobium antarcticum]|nr:hypothetical protein [Candidatus Chlorobium antarcticum]